jgi:hypothetical protein
MRQALALAEAAHALPGMGLMVRQPVEVRRAQRCCPHSSCAPNPSSWWSTIVWVAPAVCCLLSARPAWQVKWAGDGQWYDATVAEVSLGAIKVVFPPNEKEGWEATMEVLPREDCGVARVRARREPPPPGAALSQGGATQLPLPPAPPRKAKQPGRRPRRRKPAAAAAVAVSRSCACIGSLCLRHCVHGASIGGGGGAEEARSACVGDGRPPHRACHGRASRVGAGGRQQAAADPGRLASSGAGGRAADAGAAAATAPWGGADRCGGRGVLFGGRFRLRFTYVTSVLVKRY